MSSILLYHHLGLGDHFMCHGIVREYCKKYEKVGIFCYAHNYPTVSFMYRDLPNLTIIQGDDAAAKEFIGQNASRSGKSKYDEVKIIGFQNLNRNDGIPLEWQFYQIAGVPIEKKWDSFFIKRDFKKEQALFKKVAPKGDYVFIHDDIPRKYVIKKELINKNYTMFTPGKESTNNIIDYCTIIEKAKEIHVIDSSFMFLIDCLPYSNPNQKLYIHRYARDNNEWQLPILKKDWYIFIERHDKREPVRDLLQKLSNSSVSMLNTTLVKRVVRKIFMTMNWSMIRPKRPDLKALIQRYVPGKSLAVISTERTAKNPYVAAAQETGAITINTTTIEKAVSADIVFYSEMSSKNPNSFVLFNQLRSLTNQILILNTPSVIKTSNKKSKGDLTPGDIESMLNQAGFKIREKHLFPLETCFVCRAVSTQ